MSPKIVLDNFSGGENLRESRRSMPMTDTFSTGATSSNLQSGATGRMERRYGIGENESGFTAGGVTTSHAITGAAMYRPTNTGGSKYLLFAANTYIRLATYSGGTFTYDSIIPSSSNVNQQNGPVDMAQFRDWMYVAVPLDASTTNGQLYRFDGVKSDGSFGGASGWTTASLEVPIIAGLTATSAAAGGRMAFAGTAAAGEYRYRFTYVHGVLGESDMSSPVNASALGAATAAGQVTLASMPWTAAGYRNNSSRRTITGYRVYRTLETPNLNDDTLNTYYLIAEVTNFATATYVDVKADLELVSAYAGDGAIYDISAAIFLTGLSPTHLCAHRGRMWYGNHFDRVANVQRKSLLSWSRLYTPCKVDGWIELSSEDGQSITALRSFNGELIVLKSASIHAVSGDSPQNFTHRTVIADLGCIAPRSIAEGDGYLFWLSGRGVVRWNGYSVPEIISDKIRPYFETMSATGKLNAAGGFHRGRYFLSVGQYESAVWVYDNSYGSPGSWWKWNNLTATSSVNAYMFLKLDEVQENGEFYLLSDATGSAGGGQIRQIHDAFSNSGAPRYTDRTQGTDRAIDGPYYASLQMDAESPETIKRWKSITVDAEELADGVSIAWQVDGGMESGGILVTPPTITGSGTEASPYTSASNTRPLCYTLPDKANGRRFEFDLNQQGSTTKKKPIRINRITVEYEDTGESRNYGTY